MTKILSTRLTALLLATTVMVAPEMASAQGRHYSPAYDGLGGYHSYDAQGRNNWDSRGGYRDNHSDAVAAGVVGLAFGAILGAALASNHHRHSNEYYGDGYNRDGYSGDGGRRSEWRGQDEGYDGRGYAGDRARNDGYYGDGPREGWRGNYHDDGGD